MDILQRIQDLIKQKNLSVCKLADKCEIPKNTIYRWYSKNYTPSLYILQIVCEKGFEISLAEFFDVAYVPETDAELKKFILSYKQLNDEKKKQLNDFIEKLISE